MTDFARTISDREEEREFIDTWGQIEQLCLDAISKRQETIKLEFSPRLWLKIIEEIKDRRPRNYSRLLADDTIEQLRDAISLVHDAAQAVHHEAAFMIAFGPRRNVSDAFKKKG